ncbi:MAG: hypothetical protein HY331_04055 [Chloroflexi bacterium]|nr:hypothetical protein [Chloroflexota bacterium]
METGAVVTTKEFLAHLARLVEKGAYDEALQLNERVYDRDPALIEEMSDKDFAIAAGLLESARMMSQRLRWDSEHQPEAERRAG